ncbi:MAG: membrane protein insertase YidC [Pelagibacteraceae bacterium]|nr:membrane protein insertase YidC [Pelagibacteraceae bacterium]
MNEQKNLFLAIGISIFIIVIFQFLFPTSINKSIESVENEILAPATSIDEQKTNIIEIIKPKEDVLLVNKRINIETPSVTGSINLQGAILDDLTLSNYKVSMEEGSKNIDLLSPDGTANPYYIEFGWKALNNQSTQLPNLETIWEANSSNLTPGNSVRLSWTSSENNTFIMNFTVDENYMFSVKQEVINNSSSKLEIYPYRLIKRINTPKTINFFILHEGLISLVNDELLEKGYDDLLDDCSSSMPIKDSFCDAKAQGGWLGFTDKYWMSVLIPDPNEPINVNYRHGNNGRDSYRMGYVGQVFNVAPGNSISYNGKVFAGAKKLDILSQYDKSLSIERFTDSIDWGWFAFLTKPVSYAINWFYGYAGNFGLAIIAFTILMRLILFPLAHASFKSMAKMKKLQPEMQRLKETYPNDRQKMQQELMALYKREGANPVAGCLPILVQIPIFFSLYKVLFVTIEMYHAPFYGWIHDLSAPDPLGILTVFGLISWDVPGALSIINIGILPIIMGLTMWLQQKLNPAPADATQAKIFALLPFVFTFVLAGFAAGLVLYWSVNNILSIAQQWFIQRKILAKNG